MDDVQFDRVVQTFLGDDTPRVWSLLVTIFGDLALASEARLSGACLNALASAFAIKPETTRVALHRLRKEGWIDSQRTGRQSRYGLTSRGRAETRAAVPRVYGPAPVAQQVVIVIEDPACPVDPAQIETTGTTVQIGPRLLVSTVAHWDAPQLALPLPNRTTLPRWISDRLCPPEVQEASRRLQDRLACVRDDPALETLTRMQTTALRLIVLHEWRRLILRVPPLPDALFSQGWHGAECRRDVAVLLERLPRPDPKDLEQAVVAP